MGKNKSKSTGRRPGKGPHPKAGEGKHNKSNKLRSRSIGSSASLASREDLKSIDDNHQSHDGEVVNLDDFVMTSPPPPRTNDNNNENQKFRATSPLPSTVTIETKTKVFTPIQEADEPPNTPVPASVVAAATGMTGTPVGGIGGKTPFNSPEAVVVAVASSEAKKEEAEPEVTTTTPTKSTLLRAPESSPEPAPAVAATTTTSSPEPVAVEPAAVDVWSSNLKDHVTVERDGPAVLDVSTDYGYDEAKALVVATSSSPPPPPAKKVAPPPTEATAPVLDAKAKAMGSAVAGSTAPAPPAALAEPAAAVTKGRNDLVVDLLAPHPREAAPASATGQHARADDCQCAIL